MTNQSPVSIIYHTHKILHSLFTAGKNGQLNHVPKYDTVLKQNKKHDGKPKYMFCYLEHELRDDPVEDAALVSLAIGGLAGAQLQHDASHGAIHDGNSKKRRVRGGEGGGGGGVVNDDI